MSESIALKSLHLEYRIWIAELNFDINLIRIFNDSLLELTPAYKAETASFEIKFNTSRETIDELRHRMHIEKMNLAAITRDKNTLSQYETRITENHKTIRDDFFRFRVLFNDLKSDFLRFESNK
ncbi:MAG: hypothetical protein JSS70_03700 [Bacteroidetes bacterium]|nr:hypothetical protein [Bacteroidota bacterium]